MLIYAIFSNIFSAILLMRYILLLICWLCCTGLSAQDQIFKKDNTKIEAKILEISQNDVKYKLFSHQDGPTIIVNKNDIALIIYQNGVHEVFNAKPEPQKVIIYGDHNPEAEKN